MRMRLVGLFAVLSVGVFATPSKAQDGGFSDPFFLYYGFYLPRQAALAAQPQPEDSIRALSAARQVSVQNERAGLGGPIGTLGMEELDPLRPFGQRSGGYRSPRATSIMHNQNSTVTMGTGVTGRYQNSGGYFPGQRVGRARNAGARSSLGAAPRSPINVPNAQSGIMSFRR